MVLTVWCRPMDADLDRRVSRCGRCLHQLVVIAVSSCCSRTETVSGWADHSIQGQKQPSSVFAQETETLGLQGPCKVRARNGFTHDFTLCRGCAPELAASESVGFQPAVFVILLCKTLPKNVNHIVYFDNWFNFPELQLRRKQLGFHSVWTLRANGLWGCSLKSESDLRKARCGSYDNKVDANSGLGVIRWYDNRAVQISATLVGIHPIKIVKHWDKKVKKYVEVQCPAAVIEYTAHMGGVDLFDVLSAMYHIDHKSVKWYRRIFYWVLNVACINGWVLYKHHCSQLAVPEK